MEKSPPDPQSEMKSGRSIGTCVRTHFLKSDFRLECIFPLLATSTLLHDRSNAQTPRQAQFARDCICRKSLIEGIGNSRRIYLRGIFLYAS